MASLHSNYAAPWRHLIHRMSTHDVEHHSMLAEASLLPFTVRPIRLIASCHCSCPRKKILAETHVYLPSEYMERWVTPRSGGENIQLPVRRPLPNFVRHSYDSSDTDLPTSMPYMAFRFVTFLFLCVCEPPFFLTVFFCQCFVAERCAPMYILAKVWTNRKEHLGSLSNTGETGPLCFFFWFV